MLKEMSPRTRSAARSTLLHTRAPPPPATRFGRRCSPRMHRATRSARPRALHHLLPLHRPLRSPAHSPPHPVTAVPRALAAPSYRRSPPRAAVAPGGSRENGRWRQGRSGSIRAGVGGNIRLLTLASSTAPCSSHIAEFYMQRETLKGPLLS